MAFAANYTSPATGGAALNTLYARLVAAGWVITNESDGVNPIPSTFNGTVPSSWFAASEPGAGTRSWCFQADAGGNQTKARVKCARADFVTGGDPTHVPSAVGEQLLIGGGTNGAPTFSTLFPADGTYRWAVCCDGASPYGWYAASFLTGGVPNLNVRTFLLFDPLMADSYPGTDTQPYVNRAAFCSDPSSYSGTILGALNTYSDGSSASVASNSNLWAKSANGTWVPLLQVYPATTGPSLGTGRVGTDGQFGPEVYTSFEQRLLVGYARSTEGFVGYSTMVTCGTCVTGPARSTGDVLLVGAAYYLRLDFLYLPWDSTPVVV